MFNEILKELTSIVPILAIREANNQLLIEYDNYTPSSQEQIEINNLLNAWPLKKMQYQKIKLMNIIWQNKIKEGLQTTYGWNLGIDISDVALLNGAFTLAKEANSLGINDLISIVDIDGLSHSLNFSELTQLMLSYGQARSQLSNNYANKINQIKNATSTEELNSLDLTI